jgi:carotenoid cleavage dioxygenase-like enzyme
MRDWRKAWYTYGQCDTSITPEECNDYTSSLHASSSNDKIEEGNEKQMVVNPFTGEANYEITEVDGTLPDDLVGVLYRNGECRDVCILGLHSC